MSIRPSGSQLVAQPSPSGPRPATSLLPSRSTATISPVPQFENHKRPSCHRGDSPVASPSRSTRGSMTCEVDPDIATSFTTAVITALRRPRPPSLGGSIGQTAGDDETHRTPATRNHRSFLHRRRECPCPGFEPAHRRPRHSRDVGFCWIWRQRERRTRRLVRGPESQLETLTLSLTDRAARPSPGWLA
jgi:hypothetical protein